VGDFFEILGVPRRFVLDGTDLESRFYQLSRENHPDRFTTAGARAQQLSLEKMSQLNQAYRALKDPSQRRDHILELEGVAISEKAQSSQVPMDLAESWFELQDALMEDPAAATAKLAEFEKEFVALKNSRESAIAALEHEADQALDRSDWVAYRGFLAQIADSIRQQSYLNSMARDIERLKRAS
jgi:molecular chaperone HscB